MKPFKKMLRELAKERNRQRLEDEERRNQEYIKAHPPPPAPPWTPEQLKAIDRMEEILRTLIYGQSRNINLVFEFLSFEYLFEGSSLRTWDLRRKANHYLELHQYAAKENLWGKMSQILYCLQTEVSSLRRRRDRGGTSAQ